jgi:hypothetical protein
MKQVDLESWDEYPRLVGKIRDEQDAHVLEVREKRYPRKERILFRGQSDSEWRLETTLERESSDRFDVFKYWARANQCMSEIQSFTGKRWKEMSHTDAQNTIKDELDSMTLPPLPQYDYLVYLRHYAFPSPLLDWSVSPYVAAYFAFSNRQAANSDGRQEETGKVAIYSYIETPEGSKGLYEGGPMITPLSPVVTTDARHFAQQAVYTVATKWSEERRCHDFCPHDKVFEKNRPQQDVLTKITLPASERKAALNDLKDHNINHFTLFQSEDSLVRAMSMKHFDLKSTR